MIELPPGVTFIKRELAERVWTYDFGHSELGPIGRVVLTELPDDARTHVSCEVAVDPDDALTAERRALFEPLGLEIALRLEDALAKRRRRSSAVTDPSVPPSGPD
ncbi:hypothetical protein [Sphingomonas lenta]|uniref:Polyketide cyclase / dehydrase and lipid transport n=1 Tax=Sphingomonas lenta TaxID=1141887 RepID=A0A2A2SAW3_9SPHN|nr:hypothetical protein [Sphingomonas lenta]PAX06389.1 hypothetical protein CKY28_17460 [Sphingomonas lenta]